MHCNVRAGIIRQNIICQLSGNCTETPLSYVSYDEMHHACGVYKQEPGGQQAKKVDSYEPVIPDQKWQSWKHFMQAGQLRVAWFMGRRQIVLEISAWECSQMFIYGVQLYKCSALAFHWGVPVPMSYSGLGKARAILFVKWKKLESKKLPIRISILPQGGLYLMVRPAFPFRPMRVNFGPKSENYSSWNILKRGHKKLYILSWKSIYDMKMVQ